MGLELELGEGGLQLGRCNQLPSPSGPSILFCLVAATEPAWALFGYPDVASHLGYKVLVRDERGFSSEALCFLPSGSTFPMDAGPAAIGYSGELGLFSQLFQQTQNCTWGQDMPS